jgi:hypothetical protein
MLYNFEIVKVIMFFQVYGFVKTIMLRSANKPLHSIFLRGMRRLLVTASVVPSSPFLVTLMKEALSSSKTSVLT